MRRPGVQTIRKAHALSFSEYACLAWPRVGLPTDLPFDPVSVDAMLAHQGKVVAYFSLVLLLAPVVETLVLLDRMIFLQEREVSRVNSSHFLMLLFPHETWYWWPSSPNKHRAE